MQQLLLLYLLLEKRHLCFFFPTSIGFVFALCGSISPFSFLITKCLRLGTIFFKMKFLFSSQFERLQIQTHDVGSGEGPGDRSPHGGWYQEQRKGM
jgi:hypothetical protein